MPAPRLLRRPLAALSLLALVFTGGPVAEARIRGDMEIAGSPMRSPPRATPAPILRPNEPFTYRCQAELNDYREQRHRRREYTGRQVPYDLWAVSEFLLDTKRSIVKTEDLDWEWIAAVEEPNVPRGAVEIPLAGPPPGAFSTAGFSIQISVVPEKTSPAESPELAPKTEPAQVFLRGVLTLDVGDYFHLDYANAQGPAAVGSYIYFQKDIQLFRRAPSKGGQPAMLWRRFYVGCTREQ